MKTVYTNLYEVNKVQQQIIRFIMDWCKKEKVPIPQTNILKGLKEDGVKEKTVIHNLLGLAKLGYIRKAQARYKEHHQTCYVLLRTI